MSNLENINLTKEDFETLCICSIRYCMGRRTYMPSLVQDIIRNNLPELSYNALNVILQDKEFQARFDMYGDACDKENWIRFWRDVEAEIARRKS